MKKITLIFAICLSSINVSAKLRYLNSQSFNNYEAGFLKMTLAPSSLGLYKIFEDNLNRSTLRTLSSDNDICHGEENYIFSAWATPEKKKTPRIIDADLFLFCVNSLLDGQVLIEALKSETKSVECFYGLTSADKSIHCHGFRIGM